MSHTVKIEAKVDSPADLAEACRRLGLEPPQSGTHQLYTATADGLAVKLPGWMWPVVFNLETGKASYDNFNGNWGNPDQLTDFLHHHDVARTKRIYAEQGRAVTEIELPNDAGVQLVEEIWT